MTYFDFLTFELEATFANTDGTRLDPLYYYEKTCTFSKQFYLSWKEHADEDVKANFVTGATDWLADYLKQSFDDLRVKYGTKNAHLTLELTLNDTDTSLSHWHLKERAKTSLEVTKETDFDELAFELVERLVHDYKTDRLFELVTSF